jgi:hypothetical protein
MVKFIALFYIFFFVPILSETPNMLVECYRGNTLPGQKNGCQCTEGYTTFSISPNDNITQCNYELKSHNAALFLSLFGGLIGADRFYLGYNFKGIIKVLLPLIFFFFILHFSDSIHISSWKYKNFIIFLPLITMFLFWVIDIIFIYFGLLKDANGIELL